MLAVANILLTLTGIYGDFRGLYEQSDSLEISDFRRFAALQRTTRRKPKRTPNTPLDARQSLFRKKGAEFETGQACTAKDGETGRPCSKNVKP